MIEARRLKSGRALRILTGPAAGIVCHSLSGAMQLATLRQREEQHLGHKGVANGWKFWKARKEARK